MNAITFSESTRVKKARLAQKLRLFMNFVPGAAGLLIAGAIFLYLSSSRWANGILALALGQLILYWWYSWDLSVLEVKAGAGDNSGLVLDDVVSADLAAGMVWPITTSQMWALAIHQASGKFMVERLELDLAAAENIISSLETQSDLVWQEARSLQLQAMLSALDAACLLTAFLITNPGLLAAASRSSIQAQDVLEAFLWYSRTVHAVDAKKHQVKLGGVGKDWASGYTPLLNRYAYNISADIAQSKSSYFNLARSKTLDQLITDLGRADRHNVIIVGAQGSGKTSLVYALAERMLYISQQKSTIAFQVMGLNPALITSSSQVPGEIEQLLLNLLGDAVHAGNVLLFLDEAQLFLQRGVGALDISQLLLSVVQQTSLRIVLALTPSDYQNLVTVNSALAGLFNVVNMPELSQPEVVALLQDRAISLERGGKKVTYQALSTVYRLAGRHINTEAFPGKAIKLLEDSFNYPVGTLITAASVETCIEQTMGIKSGPAGEEEKQQLLNLEDLLHQRMINQARAVSAVSTALRRNRAGVGSTKRPAGSFLFLGPTGVGKTELTKALAEVYFGGVDHVIRLDMSEYQQAADVTRILSPNTQGQSGTNLLTGVRRAPFSVVLLDELEKAHPDILNLLLQMLDEGQLTDTSGQVTDFRNCIIIATSNAGADAIRQHVAAGEELEKFEKQIIDELIASHQFRPELINRFDEVVLFRPLNKPELKQVAALLLNEVNSTLATQNISVELTDVAVDFLIEKGYDPQFGARPLRRLIQQTVQNRVADGILRGEYAPGAKINLDKSDLEAVSTSRNG